MKTLSLLFACVLLTLNNYSQNNVPNWNWAKSTNGIGNELSTSITSDNNGNTIVTGYFKDSSVSFGSTTLNNLGDYDIFIAKYDGAGNILWAKSASGISFDYPNDVTTDVNGNIYLVGISNSSSLTFGTTTFNNKGGFILKYDAQGNEIWAKSISGTVNGIVTDINGNIYVAGGFTDSTILLGSNNLVNNGMTDFFVLKYDNNGNVLWAKSNGGTSYEYINKISIDSIGNIYITGEFGQSLTFGTTTLISSGFRDIFIAKYDNSGNIIWSNSFGGNDSEYVHNISTDFNGNTYVIGDFYSAVLTVGTTSLININNSDLFIVKYDSIGDLAWAKSAGGSQSDYARGVTIDNYGNSYIAGYFSSPTINFDTTYFNNSGSYNVFITKYNSLGDVIWVKLNSADYAGDLAIDGADKLILTGAFGMGSYSFDTISLINTNTTTLSNDAFVAKMDAYPLTIHQNNQKEKSLLVYPNPFNNEITINYALRNSVATLTIYNLIGEEIKHQVITKQTTVINLANQSKGIYFVSIIDGNNRATRKIIKQ